MVKNKITYQDYFSKVYGCWLGKCIAGNVGAPYEGMKQKLSLKYTPEYLEKMLPNDDLDLQVLWLEVLRKKGEYFTSDDLAEIFAANCDYAPGEYAFFKKNYRRGIPAPYAGAFNNEYYTDGMGGADPFRDLGVYLSGEPVTCSKVCGDGCSGRPS